MIRSDGTTDMLICQQTLISNVFTILEITINPKNNGIEGTNI